MEDRTIPDSAITASSEFSSAFQAHLGRLHNQAVGFFTSSFRSSSWSALNQQAGEYLQVDLGRVFYVTKVATQGMKSTMLNNWVMSYSLKYSLDGTTLTWNDYLDLGGGSKVRLLIR
jgi:fatty acid-binding protein DegV